VSGFWTWWWSESGWRTWSAGRWAGRTCGRWRGCGRQISDGGSSSSRATCGMPSAARFPSAVPLKRGLPHVPTLSLPATLAHLPSPHSGGAGEEGEGGRTSVLRHRAPIPLTTSDRAGRGRRRRAGAAQVFGLGEDPGAAGLAAGSSVVQTAAHCHELLAWIVLTDHAAGGGGPGAVRTLQTRDAEHTTRLLAQLTSAATDNAANGDSGGDVGDSLGTPMEFEGRLRRVRRMEAALATVLRVAGLQAAAAAAVRRVHGTVAELAAAYSACASDVHRRLLLDGVLAGDAALSERVWRAVAAFGPAGAGAAASVPGDGGETESESESEDGSEGSADGGKRRRGPAVQRAAQAGGVAPAPAWVVPAGGAFGSVWGRMVVGECSAKVRAGLLLLSYALLASCPLGVVCTLGNRLDGDVINPPALCSPPPPPLSSHTPGSWRPSCRLASPCRTGSSSTSASTTPRPPPVGSLAWAKGVVGPSPPPTPPWRTAWLSAVRSGSCAPRTPHPHPHPPQVGGWAGRRAGRGGDLWT
jgi:hypothetical protein